MGGDGAGPTGRPKGVPGTAVRTHKAQLLAQRSAPSLIFSSHLFLSSSHKALKTKVTAAVLARGLYPGGKMGSRQRQLYLLLLPSLLPSLTRASALHPLPGRLLSLVRGKCQIQ